MNLVDHMAQMAEQFEQHPGPATEPLFSGPGSRLANFGEVTW